MKRPSYNEAVNWLAQNDDCHWLADEEPVPSVAACLVADMFDVVEKRLKADILRALKIIQPTHEALRDKPRDDGTWIEPGHEPGA